MRVYFSTYHLWASEEFAKRTKSLEAAQNGMPRFDIEHRAHVMVSLTEAGAFLESLINELFKDCADNHMAYIGGLSAHSIHALATRWADWHRKGGRRPGALEKFDAALTCCGLPPMNHGIAPIQDAKQVLELRNALMHAKPESATDDSLAFANLKSKFPANALTRGTNCAFFPDKCLGSGCALWAAKSTRIFADHFHVLIGTCRIPDDCIDSKRYPLFIARTVLRELIESLEPTGSVKP